MIHIAVFHFNPICENTYVAWDESGECVIIDAGNSCNREDEALSKLIADKSLRPVMLVNTHGHFDHSLGVAYVKRTYGVPFALHSDDRFLIESAQINASVFGVRVDTLPLPDVDLKSKTEISFGNTTLQLIHTPGHTPGHVCLYSPDDKIIFTGDTLFRESIGRTDLPGGDYSWIMRSIIDKILPLGDEVRVLPGHGDDSTIGHESIYNPFITEVLNNEVNI